jgi:hypothetical protein
MNKETGTAPKPKLLELIRKYLIAIFAVFGFFCTFGAPMLRIAFSPLLEQKIVQRVYSPNRFFSAEVEVTRGGFGTVWTTSVYVRPHDEERWNVYETSDSEFVPPLRWLDQETLILGLPCERVDRLSNPDDWERSNPKKRRLKVRFEYARDCE